jgi:uncharacterized membrane protein
MSELPNELSNQLWKNLGIVALYATHYLSIAVWVGVMLFNLIVNFPAIRARTRTPSDYVGAMSAQSKRAGPWLYILVALTLVSGWGLSLLHGTPLAGQFGAVMMTKNALLVLMLALHMWGSFSLWPKIHFAVEAEWPALFLQYQMSIALSSVFGITAIFLTYMARVFPVA